jgi:hypothetical protein
MPSDGKSSHCLWQSELLKKVLNYISLTLYDDLLVTLVINILTKFQVGLCIFSFVAS